MEPNLQSKLNTIKERVSLGDNLQKTKTTLLTPKKNQRGKYKRVKTDTYIG